MDQSGFSARAFILDHLNPMKPIFSDNFPHLHIGRMIVITQAG